MYPNKLKSQLIVHFSSGQKKNLQFVSTHTGHVLHRTAVYIKKTMSPPFLQFDAMFRCVWERFLYKHPVQSSAAFAAVDKVSNIPNICSCFTQNSTSTDAC
ncbi:hypothetical protein CDAR_106121 [Caerostris darwini]|uniref:LAGLIDADG homing endonuclease n=1 Tax=Caerostris darwini TaxID=1538125 RepID=A0AAV4NUV4_9ARAC|nr:hypothetical protein CDAR_106121 [Caerostris darwini]